MGSEGSVFRSLFDEGQASRCLIIAELSASHGGELERALELVEIAHQVGADVVKLQTYRPDTITIDSDREYFIRHGTIWDGRRLYDLYDEAHTPWEWHSPLFERAAEVGIPIFSTPFDPTAVEFLEEMDVPAHKIGSFELVDIPLIRRVSKTGKPLIMSTGMATLSEIEEAYQTALDAGLREVALMKTNSAYPSPVEESHLRTIGHLGETFEAPVGLSDHTLGAAVPVAAVAAGAQLVEKHLCVSRSIDTPDSDFASEPREFEAMVSGIRDAEEAMGTICYGPTPTQEASIENRRSLFVVRNMEAGERLSKENLRSIRPGHGLHPRYLDRLLGARIRRDVRRGTPMSWDLVLGR